ncbi:amidohydrolase family protein [Rhizobium sp. A37_96]
MPYTRAGAWVEFQEDRKGKLAPGYLADIVILDADLTSVPSDELSGVLPVMTICNGKVIYRDDEF